MRISQSKTLAVIVDILMIVLLHSFRDIDIDIDTDTDTDAQRHTQRHTHNAAPLIYLEQQQVEALMGTIRTCEIWYGAKG